MKRQLGPAWASRMTSGYMVHRPRMGYRDRRHGGWWKFPSSTHFPARMRTAQSITSFRPLFPILPLAVKKGLRPSCQPQFEPTAPDKRAIEHRREWVPSRIKHERPQRAGRPPPHMPPLPLRLVKLEYWRGHADALTLTAARKAAAKFRFCVRGGKRAGVNAACR